MRHARTRWTASPTQRRDDLGDFLAPDLGRRERHGGRSPRRRSCREPRRIVVRRLSERFEDAPPLRQGRREFVVEACAPAPASPERTAATSRATTARVSSPTPHPSRLQITSSRTPVACAVVAATRRSICVRSPDRTALAAPRPARHAGRRSRRSRLPLEPLQTGSATATASSTRPAVASANATVAVAQRRRTSSPTRDRSPDTLVRPSPRRSTTSALGPRATGLAAFRSKLPYRRRSSLAHGPVPEDKGGSCQARR